jgi:hypothetical protein
VSSIDDTLSAALKALPEKPAETATAPEKKRYSEQISNAVAQAFAAELRARGLNNARPAPPGEIGLSGAERRMAGGIGAKKVDVTWATDESGLLLAVSVKTINFRDSRTRNFQKNLTNRRGDMLFESTTLHRRFPFAVLYGFLFLDKDAEHDGTAQRRSTFLNAHRRFHLFTDRDDPGSRDEQYEKLYIVLLDANQFTPTYRAFAVGKPEVEVPFEQVFDEIIERVADRNPDFYECVDGKIRSAR